jgi:FAD/FMN-containing dehydrogenase
MKLILRGSKFYRRSYSTHPELPHKDFTSQLRQANVEQGHYTRLTRKGQEFSMKEALAALQKDISFLGVDEDTSAYETPWRGGERGTSYGVFFPKSTEEVQEIVRTCYHHRWPILPQGGNTGLVFGGTPPRDAEKPPVIINLRNMKQLLGEIDPINRTVIAHGGMVLETFKELMEEKGYLFSLDMGSKGSAQLAGAASTNAGGTNFLRYGGMREQVAGLRVVLPNGDLLDTMSNVQKDNTGFPLTPMFLGAEGSLGIITELKLKLHPLPKQKETALLAVRDVEAATELLQSLKYNFGEELSAFELMSSEAYNLVVNRPGKGDLFAGHQEPGEEPYSHYVLVEFTSSKAKNEHFDLEQQLMANVEKGFESGLIRNAILDKPHTLWGIRESISESASHTGIVIPNDISVPIVKIPAFLTTVGKEIIEKWPELQLKIGYFGHLGDGNLHYNLLQPKGVTPKITQEQKQQIEDYVSERVIAFGGSPVAEHGIGTKNIHAMQAYKNPVALALMKQIKQTLDPYNIMNPYVFFGMGMTERVQGHDR